jgi:predicted metal-dependent hydrolase
MESRLERSVAALGLPPEWRVRVQRRPRRATLGVEVDADGAVTLAVPENATPEDVVKALQGQVGRVARAVARRKAAGARHPVKELVDGEHFDYLGRAYRLRLTASESPKVALHGDWLELGVAAGARPQARNLIDWYTARGEEWVRKSFSALARSAGVTPPVVTVRNLGARWGLRLKDGRIAVHWATFQLPPSLVELVAAHELTHVRFGRHSTAFRQQLRKLVPDLAVRERLLADMERLAWLGEVRR